MPASASTGPDRSPVADFDVINQELARYAPDLATKPQIVVLNKLDAGTTHGTVEEHVEAFRARGIELLTMSAATGEGVDRVLERLWPHVRRDTVDPHDVG